MRYPPATIVGKLKWESMLIAMNYKLREFDFNIFVIFIIIEIIQPLEALVKKFPEYLKL